MTTEAARKRKYRFRSLSKTVANLDSTAPTWLQVTPSFTFSTCFYRFRLHLGNRVCWIIYGRYGHIASFWSQFILRQTRPIEFPLVVDWYRIQLGQHWHFKTCIIVAKTHSSKVATLRLWKYGSNASAQPADIFGGGQNDGNWCCT